MILNGLAKLKFFKMVFKEKWMTGFEDKDPIIQIFLINEWFGTVGYKISIISRYIKDDFGYIVSTNEGEFYKYGIKTRIEADNLAIERATEDYNERNS
jgi:hypothetical protein